MLVGSGVKSYKARS